MSPGTSFDARPPTGAFFAVAGAPASGKSTVAGLLARALHAVLLDQDTLTLPLIEAVMDALGTSDIDDPRLRALVRDRRYDVLRDATLENLALGHQVVAVAPFTAECREPARWAKWRRAVGRYGASALLVWVDTPQATVEAFMRARGAPRDRLKLQRAAPAGPKQPGDGAPGEPAVEHVRLPWPAEDADAAIRALAEELRRRSHG